MATASGPEPISLLCELSLEDRFNDHSQGALHDAITHRGYSQRPFLAASWLWDPDPFDWLWLVGAFVDVPLDGQQPIFTVSLEALHRDSIDSTRPCIALHLLPRQLKYVQPTHFIDQAEPLVSFALPAEVFQHLLTPDAALCPIALPWVFSPLFILFRN